MDEREDVRVLVPSDKSYRWGYGGKLSKVSIPYMKVRNPKSHHNDEQAGEEYWDISRTTQLPQAMDFFFDIPAGQRPWISAVGGDGYGFIQTSTDELKGRKLFVWGREPRQELADLPVPTGQCIPRDLGRSGPHPAGASAHEGQ